MKKIYNVFPDWVIEDHMPLESQLPTILDDVKKLGKHREAYGWCTEMNMLTKTLQHTRRYVGNYFLDLAKQHFTTSIDSKNLELVNTNFLGINQGQFTNSFWYPKRWYQYALWLQADTKSSPLQLRNNLTPETEIIMPKSLKVAYWPAHIPCYFMENRSSEETIVMVGGLVLHQP